MKLDKKDIFIWALSTIVCVLLFIVSDRGWRIEMQKDIIKKYEKEIDALRLEILEQIIDNKNQKKDCVC